jgi:hypothetical protein
MGCKVGDEGLAGVDYFLATPVAQGDVHMERASCGLG